MGGRKFPAWFMSCKQSDLPTMLVCIENLLSGGLWLRLRSQCRGAGIQPLVRELDLSCLN